MGIYQKFQLSNPEFFSIQTSVVTNFRPHLKKSTCYIRPVVTNFQRKTTIAFENFPHGPPIKGGNHLNPTPTRDSAITWLRFGITVECHRRSRDINSALIATEIQFRSRFKIQLFPISPLCENPGPLYRVIWKTHPCNIISRLYCLQCAGTYALHIIFCGCVCAL